MPEVAKLEKARLVEIVLPNGDKPSKETGKDNDLTVQFNPETLKVTYSNTMKGSDQSGGAAIQYVSKSSTKLAVELWFDATASADITDVRSLTKKVNHFMVPTAQGEGLAPPGIRFLWGSFLFEGVMASMDETLDFFSADGKPLRAKVSISLTSQDIQFRFDAATSSGGNVPGTTPKAQSQDGDSLQQMMSRDASPDGWQDVAEANGIENPRRVPPGSFVDLNAGGS